MSLTPNILQTITTKLLNSLCRSLKLPTITELQSQIQAQEREIKKQQEQAKALYRVISKIRASLDLEYIFKTTTKETCKVLRVERIAVYRFNENWGGEFVSDFEFVESDIDDIHVLGKNTVWNDSYLQEHQGGRYRENENLVVDDIYQANFSQCHIEMLEQFHVRSFATVPIFIGQKLWGILAAYQHSQTYHWQNSDIQFLTQVASQLGFAVQQAEILAAKQQKITELNQANERQEILFNLVAEIRESLDMTVLFKTTVRSIRKALQADRVNIFKFDSESNFSVGEFIAENVLPMYDSAISVKIADHCFSEKYAVLFQQGRYQVLNNIYEPGFQRCHLKMLEQFEIKAQILFPLLKGNKLWGLLCVHQCSHPRIWTTPEIQFVQQLAAQFNVALEHSDLLQNIKLQAQKLAEMNDILKQLTNIDALTQIANRRRFDEYLNFSWDLLKREQQPLTLILIDIDYFKRYNDYYGHQGGDDCLIKVAQTIAKVPQRPTDLVARYGGEEFVAILPNTNLEGGLKIAEFMKQAIAFLSVPHAQSEVSNYITLSLGIATIIPSGDMTPEKLIADADQALYEAKRQGRNRVIAYGCSMKEQLN